MSFKKRYDSDPAFRKRHKAYMLERIDCECGVNVARNYMSRHKRSEKHQKWIDRNDKVKMLEMEVRELKKKLEKKK